MLKVTENIKKEIKPLILFIIIVILSIWMCNSYTNRDIHHKYSGIKYQIANQKSEEPINIEINGKLKIGLFSDFDEFHGKITIDSKDFEYSDLVGKAGRYKKIPLFFGVNPKEPYGNIFYSGDFQKITIQIYEQEGTLQYGWSRKEGWLISAPCQNRKEAVGISNELIRNLYEDFVIE